jgi:hypothetical protein
MRYCLFAMIMGLGAASAWGQPPFLPPVGGPAPRFADLPGRLRQISSPSIRVDFQGAQVQVASSRDLSNVVLEYDDGYRQRFENLGRQVVELRGTGPHAGKQVVRASVKSGANFSGDGPGYGQRFERPGKKGEPQSQIRGGRTGRAREQ